jgi:hypothetical protein
MECYPDVGGEILMELWIGHAKRRSVCHECGEVIQSGDPVMPGRVRKKKGRRWPITLRWHPKCWYEASLKYLDASKPESVKMGNAIGRPKLLDPSTGLELSQDDRNARYLLVRRFNTTLFRRNQLTDLLWNSGEFNLKVLARYQKLTESMIGIAAKVQKLGGVPASWTRLIGDNGRDHGYLGGDCQEVSDALNMYEEDEETGDVQKEAVGIYRR